MLEYPECRTLARQIGETLNGARIRTAVAAKSPHRFAWFAGDPADYPLLLEGRRIEGAEAFGGFVELRAEDIRLIFQDGVSLRWTEPGIREPAKHQLRLEFEDGAALTATVQMYGGLMAVPVGGMDDNKYYRAARERPDPLGDGFDRACFDALLAGCNPDKLSAKAFLATEQRIPGLGNGCLHDILFRAGVHPKRKMASLNEAALDRLYRAVREVLAEMTALGGRDTEKDLFGQPGGYPTRMSKRTLAYPCPGCGGSVQKAAYLGGSVYFCATCQSL